MLTIWPISQIKSKLHERRAKYEAQKPEEKAAWRTANATVWIAFFTVVLTIVGGITLYEVIEGGNDTHDLAVAAKKQADNTHDLAVAATKQAGSTHDLAVAAQKQADVAKNALEKVQRAFLNIGTIDSLQGRIEDRVIDWRFIFGWQNDGTTPTRNMEIHRSYETRVDELPTDFTFPDYWDTPAPHPRRFMVAAPKSRVGMTPIVIPIIAIDQVINGLRGIECISTCGVGLATAMSLRGHPGTLPSSVANSPIFWEIH